MASAKWLFAFVAVFLLAMAVVTAAAASATGGREMLALIWLAANWLIFGCGFVCLSIDEAKREPTS